MAMGGPSRDPESDDRDVWVYEPVRGIDGLIDVARSLGEFEHSLDVELRRSWLLRIRPWARRRILRMQTGAARTAWEHLNRQR